MREKLLDNFKRSFDHRDLTTLLTSAANRYCGVFGMQIRFQSDLEAHPFEDSVVVQRRGPVQTYIYGVNGEIIVTRENSSARWHSQYQR